MRDPGTIWAVIAGMAIANFVVRFTPIALVSRARIPAPIARWLSYVPVAVMASLVATEVLRPGGSWLLSPRNPYLLAAIPTAFVFGKTRSFLGATLAGMVSFLAFRALVG
ncbi:MAG: AzlD domain-containing protein [Anaerosomatales bacterium]|nr:AzlD domain-containing protein [Anaerosomatales bacterium]